MNPIISSTIPAPPAATTRTVNTPSGAHPPQPSTTADTVDLSTLGRSLAAFSQASQSSVEQSEGTGYELPEEAQRLMELIQELQQQLNEKQQELAKVMADSSLNQEARRLKAAEIQASIGALTSNLMSAMTELLQMLEVTGEG